MTYTTLVGWSGILVFLVLVVLLCRQQIIRCLPEQCRQKLGVFEYDSLSSDMGETASSVSNEGTRDISSRLPTYAWTASRLAGLHSTLFDIESNIAAGDERFGLEPVGAHEIRQLMTKEGVDFDTARLKLNRQRFIEHNIDPRTGVPLDKKLVTFSNLK